MEKSLYVNVLRLGEPLDRGVVAACRDAANDWYVIKLRSDGGDKMSRVFEDAGPMNHRNLALQDTTCQVIGSRIYLIGGLCLLCEEKSVSGCDYKGCKEILCLDTRNPKDGWRTCFTLPFSGYIANSAVVDDQWLFLFPVRHPWCYGFNVADGKSIIKVSQPGNPISPPFFATCLSLGTLVRYNRVENTLYQLDWKENNWTVYDKDVLPYSEEELTSCPTVVDDGIFYMFRCITWNWELISYDLRNKKELHVVDIPRSGWPGFDGPLQLFVISKQRFCLMWKVRTFSHINRTYIYYTRFSVSYDNVVSYDLPEPSGFSDSYDVPKPCVSRGAEQEFPIVGCAVLNAVVVADRRADVANNSGVDMAGGDKRRHKKQRKKQRKKQQPKKQ